MIHKLLTSPLNLVVKIGEKVQEEVDRELYDLDNIQRKLVQLQMMYELDEITERAYKTQESDLMIRYEKAKQLEMMQWNELTKQSKK